MILEKLRQPKRDVQRVENRREFFSTPDHADQKKFILPACQTKPDEAG